MLSNSQRGNDIELTYEVQLMERSKKTVLQAAEDMITGVTIGTMQTSSGTYTPKTYCQFGPNPGAYRGEVINFTPTSERGGVVIVTFSSEIAQVKEMGFAGLFSVAAGDGLGTAYEMSKVRLVDIALPMDVVNCFPGPGFGSVGVRKLVNKSNSRCPLTAILLKPNTGQPSEHYARLAREAALGGIDYIKEDELQFNHSLCPLTERVKKIVGELKDIQQITGRKILYAPNITVGSQLGMIENAKRVVDLGASAVMINVMQVGLDSLKVLCEANIGVPIHVHRAGHDIYSRGVVGINLNVLSLAFRLGGADLIHTGPVFGNLYDPDSIIANVKALRTDLYGLRDSIPILSRSAKSAVQDSIDYLATDEDILEPANVIFLVDRDVYQDADNKTGSITKATKAFVSTVHQTTVNRRVSKRRILQNQGYVDSL
jgi:ribulose 1,5-bisphosphate carboxylase large subunit-like protein